jgi:hypothetical protein
MAAGCTGDAGPRGAIGPQGMDGAQGKQGATGMTGPPGMNGTNAMPSALSDTARQGLAISPAAITIPATATADDIEKIGNGSYLVNAVNSCADCHTAPGGMFLSGGLQFPLDGAGHFAFARNLTPDAATGMKLTEDQFIEAMQTGKDFTNMGQALAGMPFYAFRWMSTPDLQSIYAYLKAIPAVSNAVGADNLGPFAAAQPVPMPTNYDEGEKMRPLPPEQDALGNPIPDPDNVLRGLAVAAIDYGNALSTLSIDDQARFGRGSYLVAAAGCNDCHTNPDRDPTTLKINFAQYLAGGRVFTAPPPLAPLFRITRSMSANLIGQVYGFIPAQEFVTFLAVLTEGLHVEDPTPTPLVWPMPWTHFRNMTLHDLESLYTYLRYLPARTGMNDKMTQPAARYCTVNTDCNTANGETCAMAIHECLGGACSSNADCGACQDCTGGYCAAPAAGSMCLASGL